MENRLRSSNLKNKILQLLFAILIVTPHIGESQNTSNELVIAELEKSNQLESEINQKWKILANHFKMANIGSITLDSVYEIVNRGLYIENYKWYFKYNGNNQLISSANYLFIENSELSNTSEFRSYNEKQKMTDLIKIRTYERENLPDTSITLYTEQNVYSGENLLKQHIFSIKDYQLSKGLIIIRPYDSVSYTNTFEYNNENQLIYSTEFHEAPIYLYAGRYVENYFYYNETGILKYKFSPYIPFNLFSYNQQFNFYKYDYDIIGDEYIKSEKYTDANIENNVEVFNTITSWQYINYDIFTYDELGRLKTLNNSIYDINSLPVIGKHKFKAEFEYNAYNQLTHASYYSYANEDDSTSYFETTRIDNTYDANGNILEYHKTFFDARVGYWVTHTKKLYYYSSSKSALALNNPEETHINIYPNPATNGINLSLPVGFQGTYSIFSSTGQNVTMAQPVTSTIDISHLKSGIYFIKFTNKAKSEVLKFVKE